MTTGPDLLAARFDAERPHLTAVAHRLLGSRAEAEDAVQEAWFRLSRSDTSEVQNLGAWLTTVVSRVCLDALRARRSRPPPVRSALPDPVITREDVTAVGPADQTVLADSVGAALLVVLETLAPPERLAYVLHDMFDVPFDEIAPMLDTTPANARQLASRARRRVRGQTEGDPGPHARRAQRAVVDAFLAAAQEGDIDRLVAVLHADCILRADTGPGRQRVLEGADAVARGAKGFRRATAGDVDLRPVRVDGRAGLVGLRDGTPFSVLAFTIDGDRITDIAILNDPERLAALDLAALA